MTKNTIVQYAVENTDNHHQMTGYNAEIVKIGPTKDALIMEAQVPISAICPIYNERKT